MNSHLRKGIGEWLLATVMVGVALVVMVPGKGSIKGAATGQTGATERQGSVVLLKDSKGIVNGYADTDLSVVERVFSALESYGAKLELRAETKKGVDSLQVVIDGRRVGKLVTECKECEPIVYEY